MRSGVSAGSIRLRRSALALLLVALLAPRASGQPAPDGPAAPSPAVAQPELQEFVQATYPAQAQAQGLEADVVLVLEIDESGTVTDASVLERAGHGFDQAALAAARMFRFRPARRGDRPVKSKILYRYSFHLSKAPAAAAAPEPALLSGNVRVAGTRQAVAAATVRVLSGQKIVLELATDEDGHFDAGKLSAGSYTLVVEADGFEPYSSTEKLLASEQIAVTYRLAPKVDDDTTTVIVRGAPPSREVTRRTVSRRELSRVPGTSGDALRALQNLPGVARAPALSGVLIVRGNADQTTPVFIDGMWVSNVYHFGGLSSVVPTELLDEINFYPGNFSVRYGRSLGGIVDAHLRETRGDGRYHGLLQLDLVDARAMLEGPIPLASGWNFIGGFRRSHVDVWLAPLLEGEDTQISAAPVYYDYQLLADTRPTSTSYLRIGLVGFDDRLRLLDESSASGGTLDSINSTVGLGSIYQTKLSNSARAEFTLTLARSRQRFAVSSVLFDTTANALLSRGELTLKLFSNATLRTGYDVLFAPYEAIGELPEDPGPGAQDIGSFVTTPPRVFDRASLFFQPAVYAEMSMSASRRSEIVSGVRADYTHETERLDVSPRLTARHHLVADVPRTTLKAGSGLFHQAPGFIEVALADENTALRSTRSWQNSLGIEQGLGRHVELSVEGFVNLLDGLVSRQPDAAGVLRYNNYGTGRIFGAELMLRYVEDEDFFGWVSYTLSRSERTWRPGQPSQLFYLDQPHILTALGSYNLGSGWEVGARFRYVTGNLYTPCNGGIFSSTATSYLCLNGPPNSRRLPSFHQLDVRVDKRWVLPSFTLGVYLDLINAYNRTNPDFISYNYDFTRSRPQTGSLPIVPSLGVRGEF